MSTVSPSQGPHTGKGSTSGAFFKSRGSSSKLLLSIAKNNGYQADLVKFLDFSSGGGFQKSVMFKTEFKHVKKNHGYQLEGG